MYDRQKPVKLDHLLELGLFEGYYTGVATVRHRQHQRGGVKCYEDAGYQFCETHPDVLVKLETVSAFFRKANFAWLIQRRRVN